MTLLNRVATLVRANLNDLIDKAEDPEKMIKQIILDMQNQLMQVKTQLAISIADQHLLEKKQKEHDQKETEWTRKAELAVGKQQDELARAALERSISCRRLAESFRQQVEDQKVQVENLKSAFNKLEQKLDEAQNKSDLLIAQQRRARALGKTCEASEVMAERAQMAGLDRMKERVMRNEAISQAKSELMAESLEDRFAALEKEDEIDRLLAELKSRHTSSV